MPETIPTFTLAEERKVIVVLGVIQFVNVLDFMMVMPLGPDFAGALGIISAFVWRMAGKGNLFPFAPAIILALLLHIFVPDVYATFWQLYGIKM